MTYTQPRTQSTVEGDIRGFAEFMNDRTRATTYALILDLYDELQARKWRDMIDEDEVIYPY